MILMESKVYVVDKIKKKTTSNFFKNVNVGHKLKFTVPIAHAGSSRGRTYSVIITTHNLTTDEKVYKTFNELPKLLENFELKEE